MENDTFAIGRELKPRTVFPVSGVTFEGRQAALEALAQEFAIGKRFSNYNQGLELKPEPENKYDRFAIAVWARVQGEMKPIGYVPKRYCPSCGTFVQVRKREEPICPGCGMTLVNLPMSYLNQYLTEKHVQSGKPLACGLAWCAKGNGPGSSYGARIALWWERPIGG